MISLSLPRRVEKGRKAAGRKLFFSLSCRRQWLARCYFLFVFLLFSRLSVQKGRRRNTFRVPFETRRSAAALFLSQSLSLAALSLARSLARSCRPPSPLSFALVIPM